MKTEKIKKDIKTLRLLLGAADAEKRKVEIATEFIPQIEAAREELAMLRGVDVFESVLALHRSGLAPTIDVSNRVFTCGRPQT